MSKNLTFSLASSSPEQATVIGHTLRQMDHFLDGHVDHGSVHVERKRKEGRNRKRRARKGKENSSPVANPNTTAGASTSTEDYPQSI